MDEVEPVPGLGEQANRLVASVGRLAEGLEHTNERIEGLQRSERRHRNQVLALGLSIVFDVLLSLGLGYAIHRANTVSDKNTETVKTLCESGNESRATNVQLWEGLAAASPPATPEAKARVDAILDLVHRTFAQRDCG